MSEIMDVERLRQRCAAGESFKYLYFWGHRPATDDKVGKSCFSQWYEASFKLDGVRYASAEHYMMAAKARLFDDPRLLERIQAARSPGEAKALGREVAGFDEARWNAERVGIVIEGNLGKFGQNASLKKTFWAPPTGCWSRPARWTRSGASAWPRAIPWQPSRRPGKASTCSASP